MDQTPNSKPPDATDQAAVGTGEPIKRPRNRRLRWLVLAHVAIGLSTGTIVALIGFSPPGPHLAAAVFVGVVFCQTSLLGIWCGLGTSSWWRRLLGVMAGMGYLGLLLDFGVGEPYHDNHVIVSLATVLVAGVLLVVRCFRVRICLTTMVTTAVPRFQFSIRQLLILTTAVACLVSLGKWLGPDLVTVTEPFVLDLYGLVLATVGLISIWPVFGARPPILPGIIAVAMSAGLGFGLTRLSPHAAGMPDVWITIPSVEALSLVASLLVVRSSGYRLVRLLAANSGNGDGAARPAATP